MKPIWIEEAHLCARMACANAGYFETEPNHPPVISFSLIRDPKIMCAEDEDPPSRLYRIEPIRAKRLGINLATPIPREVARRKLQINPPFLSKPHTTFS